MYSFFVSMHVCYVCYVKLHLSVLPFGKKRDSLVLTLNMSRFSRDSFHDIYSFSVSLPFFIAWRVVTQLHMSVFLCMHISLFMVIHLYL